MADAEPDSIEIPYLMLADGAQGVGGKLYVLGGGWDRLIMPALPGRPAPFAVALGIRVPWTHTNRRFAVQLELIDADGTSIGDQLEIQAETGRPPGLRPGSAQSTPITITAQPQFPDAGRYTFVAKIDGEIKNSVGFEVVAAQRMGPPEPPQ